VRLGVFGGTFDPPHLAHQQLAQNALKSLGLERILWVLTSNPPHKEGEPLTALEHRLDMALAAIADQPQFQLSRVDIDRPAPHYAVDTVHLLRSQYLGTQIVYLMGGDSLRDLPTWYMPQEFVAVCDIIGIMRRPGTEIALEAVESQIPGITPKVKFIEAPASQISSSDIRRQALQGIDYQKFLQPQVYQIITERGLYSAGS
jgi:nicotinate-nucleotide adenylyltransferase